jgi:hypothetical protein
MPEGIRVPPDRVIGGPRRSPLEPDRGPTDAQVPRTTVQYSPTMFRKFLAE